MYDLVAPPMSGNLPFGGWFVAPIDDLWWFGGMVCGIGFTTLDRCSGSMEMCYSAIDRRGQYHRLFNACSTLGDCCVLAHFLRPLVTSHMSFPAINLHLLRGWPRNRPVWDVWWHLLGAMGDHVARGTLQRLYNLQRIHKEVHCPGSIPRDSSRKIAGWRSSPQKMGTMTVMIIHLLGRLIIQ